jgi:hypothetical protein
MNKYRELTLEELKSFEKEFINYLAVNGIDADLWKKIKKEEPAKADKLISIFGDFVYNTVLTKVEYLEVVTKNSIKYFKYLSDKAILIGIDGQNVDFSNTPSILAAIGDKENKLEIYSTSKTYSKPREEEIFDMIKIGCSISDGKLFEVLKENI